MIFNHDPLYTEIVLSNGASFVLEFVLPAHRGGWPDGTTATIEFDNGVTWNAHVVSTLMRWKRAKTDTTDAIIPDGTTYKIFIAMPEQDGPTDYKMFYGVVRRNDK